MAEGFEENIEFLNLRFVDPDDLSYRRELGAILPVLWLQAGAIGDYAGIDANCGCIFPSDAHFAILTDETAFPSFLDRLAERPDVTHVFLVTDSEDAFREMSAELPRQLHRSMLFRDYLENFRINSNRPS